MEASRITTNYKLILSIRELLDITSAVFDRIETLKRLQHPSTEEELQRLQEIYKGIKEMPF